MLTLRNASLNDSQAIAHLGRATFVETFGDLFVMHADDLDAYLNVTFAPAKIAGGIAKPGNRFWLAQWDGVPIGYAKLKLGSGHSAIEGQAVAQLQKIYVLREYLSCGAGKALHGAMLDCAREELKNKLWLMALDSNRRATDFYLRHGWQFAAKDTHRVGAQVFSYDVLSLTL